MGFILLVACDDAVTSSSSGSGSTGSSTSSSGGATSASSSSGFAAGGSGGGCAQGSPCMGGVCTEGNVCCPIDQACNGHCCAATEACSFGACATPGADCTDSTECPTGQYCEFSLGVPLPPPDPMCVAGAPVSTGKCLPKPPDCAPGQLPDPENPECVAKCEVIPAFPAFSPVLKYSYGGMVVAPFSDDIMMTPVVTQLDDDDCDGKITSRDIPDIVFSTFSNGQYHSGGVLHAISVVKGAVVSKWTAMNVNPTKQLAAGDLDGMPGSEIIGCTAGASPVPTAFKPDGTVLWSAPAMACFMPSIADLDHDGAPEVIVEGGILDGKTGALKHAFSAPLAGSFVVSDVTGDGVLDIVTGSQIFDASGVLVVDIGTANTSFSFGTEDWKSPWPAIGDFDKNGTPEIAVVDNLNHALLVWRYDAAAASKFAMVRSAIDINAKFAMNNCTGWGATHGGGPPTIADFNGDGTPDVATAGGIGYIVFDGKKLIDPMVAGPETILWANPTVDCSSASTGSTVFDFDGDGKAEVVYSDQQRLRIYDGSTGNVLFETCNTTATLIENPVVADVDNDGHADIVAVSNAYAHATPTIQCNDGTHDSQSGVRIFTAADGSWVRTRRIWNEHAYHVTNVNEDGTIPQNEPANWTQTGLDNFRQNKQPGSEFAAPDAVVTVEPACAGGYNIVATVRNLGEAALPAGVPVGFYQGTPGAGTQVGSLSTQTILYPFEAETLTLSLPTALSGTIFAIVDDGAAPHPEWAECRTDNNTGAAVDANCNVPQ
ncbi:MAG: FG-GAP-like repeat-containing protein [Polyangiaceae bacterium]